MNHKYLFLKSTRSILPVLLLGFLAAAEAGAADLVVGTNSPGTNTLSASTNYGLIYIGSNSTASNSLLTISGSTVTATNVYVGYGGSGNRMVITNNGATPGILNDSNAYIGYSNTSSNNSVLVAGKDSSWSNSDSLYVGYYGSSNSLVISNPGGGGNGTSSVFDSNGYIGWDSASSNNSVTVTGGGATWSNRGSLYVGYGGSGNSLVITNGGRVFDVNGYIGWGATSSNNSVLVTGAGSVWSNSGSLYVGYNGSGTLSLDNGANVYAAAVSVTNGSTVAGNGTITAPVTVNGGTLAPSGTTNLVVRGNLTFTNSAIFLWSLYNSTTNIGGYTNFSAPVVVTNGALTVTDSTLRINFGTNVSSTNGLWTTAGVTNTWQIFNGTNVGAGTNFTIAFAGSTAGYSTNSFSLVTNASGVSLRYFLSSLFYWTGSSGDWTNGGNWGPGIAPVSNATALIDNGGTAQLSTSTTIAGLIVGYTNNSNNSLSIGGGTLTVTNDIVISATNASGVNTVTVSNNAALSGRGNLYVGSNGPKANLLVSGGGRISVTSNTYIGYGVSSSNNSVQVTDANSLLSNSGSLYVGFNGSFNSLLVSNGGTVTATYIGAGYNAGANQNQVTVGSNSTVTTTDKFDVGLNGSSNSMVITNGGKVYIRATGSSIGSFNAQGNSVLITGAGSLLSNTGIYYVGFQGAGNRLTLENGGAFISDNLTIGGSTNGGLRGSNNSVLVTGGSSTLTVNTNLNVGDGGSSNSLAISNGGTVRVGGASYIGNSNTSSNNSVTVTGTDSLWSNSGTLFVGNSGSSNSLMISNGGTVKANAARLGMQSNFNLLTVDGSGSTLTLSGGNFDVGNAGSSNSLVITNGGRVYVGAGGSSIGSFNAQGNSVLITGAGSLLSNTGIYYVGFQGAGNRLTLENGGAFISDNLTIGGSTNGGLRGSNNSVLVTGGSSTLTVNTNLTIGDQGSSNSLVISNGGTVRVGGVSYIGNSNTSSNNSVLVTGAGSLWSNSGSLFVGYLGKGTLTLDNGGSVYASRVIVTNGSTLAGNGTITAQSGGVTVSGGTLAPSGSSLVVNGSLTFTNSAIFLWSLYNSTTNIGSYTDFSAPVVVTNGALTVTGSTLRISFGTNVSSADSFWATAGVTNTWQIFSGTNVNAGTNFTIAFAGSTAGYSTNSFKLLTNSDGVYLQYLLSSLFYWTGTTGNWTNGSNWAQGIAPVSNATAVIDNGGTPQLSNSTTIAGLIVGYTNNSNNRLNLIGGTLSVNGDIVISASNTSRTNTLTVTNNATLAGSGDLYVGSNGPNANLTVSGGAVSVASNTYIGYATTSSNNSVQMTVRNTNALFSNSGSLYVGYNGSFNSLTFSINNSGQQTSSLIVASSYGYIGWGTNSSNNSVTVGDQGSLWSNSGSLYVGYNGRSNRLMVSTAGQVFDVNGYVGWGTNSSNNSVTVGDQGSLWSNSGSLYVGYNGRSNRLMVSTAGQVFDVNGYVGWGTNSSNNSVQVGTNSLFSNSDSLYVGYNGSSNSLVVSGSGTVTDINGYIGWGTNSSNNSAQVSGAAGASGVGSWSNSGSLFVGYNGSSNSLVINNQGLVMDANGYIGWGTNSSNNTVTVTGTSGQGTKPAIWSNSASLYVGYSGSGNSLEISCPANASVTANVFDGDGHIGWGTNSSNNSVTVSGGGATWNNSGSLYVGYNGSSNSLVISNGGQVFDVNGYIGWGTTSSNNSVLVTGTGSVWSNSGSLFVGYNGSGTLSLGSGGTVFASNITVNAKSTLTGNGTIRTTSGTTVDGGTMAPSGTSSLVVSGNLTFTNSAIFLWSLYNSTTNIGSYTNFSAPVVVTNGALTVTGSTFTIDFTGTVSSTDSFWTTAGVTNTWQIFTGTNVNAGTNFGIAFTGNAVGFSTNSFSLLTNSSGVYLQYYLTSVFNWTDENGNFTNGTNWGPGIAPVSNATAVIDNGRTPQLSDSTTIGGLIVGNTNGGNGLEIGGGTLSVNGDIVISADNPSGTNTVTVSNNASLAGSGDLYVGSNGPNANLIISSGASVSVSNNTYIGYGAYSSNNLLSIDGGTLSNGGSVYVGYGGSGTLALDNGGNVYAVSLTVSNGSTLSGSGTITAQPGGVTVDGGTMTPSGSSSLVIKGDLTFTNSAIFLWSLYNNSAHATGYTNFSAPVEVDSGALTVSDGFFDVFFTGDVSSTNKFWRIDQSWVVMTGTNIDQGTNFGIAFAQGSITNGFDIGDFSLTSSNNSLYLNYTAGRILYYWDTDSGYWNDTNSWYSYKVPTITNSAWIDNGGTANLTNEGSAANLTVGDTTAGNALNISNGGSLTVATNLILGNATNSSNNTLTVAGSSSLTVGISLYVGNEGSGNILVVSDGGQVVDTFGFIGAGASSSNNSVLVTGTGSLWSNSGSINVGDYGSGNCLVVSNGGMVISAEGQIGLNPEASNNSVLVTGANSLWSNTGALVLGNYGSGNTLTISNGGQVTDVNGYIGNQSSSSNNSVLVTGANSLWSNSGSLNVGYYGSGTLTVADGGTVTAVGADNTSGVGRQSSFNKLVVDGSNSTVTITSGLFDVGFGDTSTANSNSLVITNGGKVYIGSGGSSIGSFNAQGNSVLITGTGSLLSNTADYYVGYGGVGNSLTISSGGAFISDNLTIGGANAFAGGSNNSVLVTGGSSTLTVLTVNTNLTIGDQGSSNSLVISNGGTVRVGGASYIGSNSASSNNSVLVTGAGSLWSNSGSLFVGYSGNGTMTLADNGSVIAGNGTLTIASQAGSAGTLNIGRLGANDTAGSITAATIAFGSGAGAINFNQTNSFTLTSSISGAGSVNQRGAGTTILTQSNSYSGGTTVAGGTLVASNANALGSGTVTLSGGTLSLPVGLTLSSLIWDSSAFIALPGVADSNYLTVTGIATITGSGTGTFDLSGATNLGTNTTELFNFGTNVFNTNQFSVTGLVTGYALSISNYNGNNTLWITPDSGLIAKTNITVVTNTATYPTVTFQTNGILDITSTADLTITSPVDVTNNGIVVLNGELNTPSMNIAPGGTLMGTGVLQLAGGTLTNSGMVSPGNSPGTLTVNGNYVQTPDGTLLIQVGNGVNDMLVVTGTATLAGTLVVEPYGGHRFQYGDKIIFMSASSFSGSFSSVVVPTGLRARVKEVGDPMLQIIIAPLSYTQLAQGRNQMGVAKALDSFIPATSGDQLVVSTSLDSLTAAEYNQAFNAIMPTFYQQIATIAFNQANAQNMELNQRLWGLRVAQGGGFSMSGLADNMPILEGQGDGSGKGVLDSKKDILRPGLDNHWGMFVDGNGIFAQANSANMLPGYNSQSGGVTTGLTYKWNDSFASGIYCGYQGTYTKSGSYGSGLGTGSSLIDNAVRFGVFGTYGQKDGKGFYANALAGGGYHNFQATRVIQYTGMNRTANSSPGAGELDTMLSTGYDIRKGRFTFGPTASLQYTYLGVNALNESGAQSLNFSSGGWNSSSMLSSLGAHAAYTWQAGRNVVVVPQISLNWQHEFMQNPYAINGNLGGTSPGFANWSATPIRDFLYTGVGVTVEFAKKWNTSFFYNAAAGNQNLTSQNIFWSLGLKF